MVTVCSTGCDKYKIVDDDVEGADDDDDDELDGGDEPDPGCREAGEAGLGENNCACKVSL